jgi:hypothetical protein
LSREKTLFKKSLFGIFEIRLTHDHENKPFGFSRTYPPNNQMDGFGQVCIYPGNIRKM